MLRSSVAFDPPQIVSKITGYSVRHTVNTSGAPVKTSSMDQSNTLIVITTHAVLQACRRLPRETH